LISHAWTPVTSGESGAVVLRSPDGSRYAKFVAAEQQAVLQAERDRLDWASGRDIATARVLDWASNREWACLLTSAVAGVSADRLSASELWEAWPSITTTLRRLHALPAGDCPFSRGLSEMFAMAEHVVSDGTVNPQFLPIEVRHMPAGELLEELRKELPQRAAEEEADLVVCHGDLCLPNVIIDPATRAVTGLIDLGRLGCADRYADVALLLANSRGTWSGEEQAVAADNRFADEYGITLSPSRQHFYLCLDALTWDSS
jgi:streptomycin 3"-kinase